MPDPLIINGHLTVPLAPIPGTNRFLLLEGIRYNGRDYPKHFISDLASIPPVFRSVFSVAGWYSMPAVFHDYDWTYDRATSTDRFKIALRDYADGNAWRTLVVTPLFVAGVEAYRKLKS